MFRSVAIVAAAAIAVTLAWAASSRAGIFGQSGFGTPPGLAKKLHKPVSAKLIATLEQASQAGLALKATPQPVYLTRISGPKLTSGNKVGLLYVGADFCPYCAGQRWGLMLVLMRFGKLHGLRYMLSSPSDVHPNTPTVTFQHASYTSRYLALQAVEIADRKRQPLMALDPAQTKIAGTFDAPPHVRFPQAIPFVYLGGRYMLTRPILMPQRLGSMNWQQIAIFLANPRSLLFQTVMPRVNLMTAAICQLDGGQPTDVCTAPGVTAAARALPEPQTAKHAT